MTPYSEEVPEIPIYLFCLIISLSLSLSLVHCYGFSPFFKVKKRILKKFCIDFLFRRNFQLEKKLSILFYYLSLSLSFSLLNFPPFVLCIIYKNQFTYLYVCWGRGLGAAGAAAATAGGWRNSTICLVWNRFRRK